MKSSEYEKMYRAEKRFWWFAGKGLLIRDWAGAWFKRGGSGLDAGCGTGANLELLKARGSWAGLDANGEAILFCVKRGHRELVWGAVEDLPFADDAFEAAAALDLFEHLEDDAAAAAEIFRCLTPGGRLLVTVPAHPGLWGAHDLALGHHRRYSRRLLEGLLTGAGFRILRISHFMGFLFPAMFLVRLFQKGIRGADTITYDWPAGLNGILLSAVRLEVAWLRRFRMPVGTTLAAVAEKPLVGLGASSSIREDGHG